MKTKKTGNHPRRLDRRHVKHSPPTPQYHCNAPQHRCSERKKTRTLCLFVCVCLCVRFGESWKNQNDREMKNKRDSTHCRCWYSQCLFSSLPAFSPQQHGSKTGRGCPRRFEYRMEGEGERPTHTNTQRENKRERKQTKHNNDFSD